MKKAQEKKLGMAEMMMLRWMSGVTKLDRIRNERIRGIPQVEVISKTVQLRLIEVVWACIEKIRRMCMQESQWRIQGGLVARKPPSAMFFLYLSHTYLKQVKNTVDQQHDTWF